MITQKDLKVGTLGKCMIRSPLNLSTQLENGVANFIPDDAKIRYQVSIQKEEDLQNELFFEKAGPRENIFFNPLQTKAAIVTCGGLCPGINNVIRSIFLELHYKYRVPEIYGIRYSDICFSRFYRSSCGSRINIKKIMFGYTFRKYQSEARKTLLNNGEDFNLLLARLVLGLAGEAGEVAEKTKKLIRDTNGEITADFRKEIAKELGDVLWYVAGIASVLGLTLTKIARQNIEKLFSRKRRGKIKGSGDNR